MADAQVEEVTGTSTPVPEAAEAKPQTTAGGGSGGAKKKKKGKR